MHQLQSLCQSVRQAHRQPDWAPACVQYVIHFGDQPQEAAEQAVRTIAAAHPDKPAPPVTALAKLRTGVAVVPTQTGSQLVSTRAMAECSWSDNGVFTGLHSIAKIQHSCASGGGHGTWA